MFVSQVKNARSLFPKMPDVVFDAWLAPLIGSDGWPFFSVNSMVFGTVWEKYLGGHSLKTVSNLEWHRKLVAPTLYSFAPCSQNIINWIISAHRRGIKTPCSNLKSGRGKASFDRSRAFVASTGRLYAPAVFIKEPLGYQIVDGNHRVAACFSLNLPIGFRIDCWIGS